MDAKESSLSKCEEQTRCLKLSIFSGTLNPDSYSQSLKKEYHPCLVLGEATVIKNGFKVYFLRQDIETEVPPSSIIHDPDILKEAEEAFVKINNIPTKVTTFGRWITEKPKAKGEKLVLVIPGNPGITGFYKQFLEILYQKLDCPVWALGHSAHEDYRKKNENSDFPDQIGLRQQIQQKISFIQEYVPEDTQLHIVGHSIGSYMTLELLKESSIQKRIFKTHLLFPTFEHMVETPNGKFLYRFVRPVLSIVIFLSWFYSILPKTISLSLLSCYMFLNNIPFAHKETIHNLIHPKVLQQVFSLAYEELKVVKERDDQNLKNNTHRVNMLYGETDGWCLPEFYVNLKKDFPDIQARLSRYMHTFVFHDNQDVADVVSKWIIDNKNE